MRGLFFLFFASVWSFRTFPDWLPNAEHFQDELNKARIEIAQGDKVINTDAMSLDKAQVEQILSELNAANISAHVSWYRTKYQRCMDEWSLSELRCDVHFYDDKIKKQCEDRLVEHKCRGFL